MSTSPKGTGKSCHHPEKMNGGTVATMHLLTGQQGKEQHKIVLGDKCAATKEVLKVQETNSSKALE